MRPANFAFKKLFGVCAWQRRERRSHFITNPATGALEIRPESWPVIEQALLAEARRIALGYQRRSLFLQLTQLFVSARLGFLKFVRLLDRTLTQCIFH
jgi:hypothetical protein